MRNINVIASCGAINLLGIYMRSVSGRVTSGIRSNLPTKLPGYVVGIIGGGPAATMTLLHFINGMRYVPPRNPVEVTWTKEPDGMEFGTGQVFGIADKRSGMPDATSQSRKMSLYAGDPNHFVRWLQKNRDIIRSMPEIDPFSFDAVDNPQKAVSRYLYGLYIRNTLDEALASLPRDLTVRRIEKPVIDVVKTPEGKERVVFDDGSSPQNDADAIVLATGRSIKRLPELARLYDEGGSPVPGFVVSTGLFHYREDKSAQTLEDIPLNNPNLNVVFVGSGIAAAGNVKRLYNRGFKGSITIISPTGEFPDVSEKDTPYTLKFFKDGNLPKTFKEAYDLYKKECEYAKANGHNAHDVIDALCTSLNSDPSVVNRTWEVWDLAEKDAFFKSSYPLKLNNKYARISPGIEIGYRVYQKEGRIISFAGKVCDAVRKENGEFEIEFVTQAGEKQTVTCGCLVNCAGLENNIRKSTNPLIQRLLERGRIEPSAFSLGVKVVSPDDVIIPVGALAQGDETIDASIMSSMRPTAARAAAKLLERKTIIEEREPFWQTLARSRAEDSVVRR